MEWIGEGIQIRPGIPHRTSYYLFFFFSLSSRKKRFGVVGPQVSKIKIKIKIMSH